MMFWYGVLFAAGIAAFILLCRLLAFGIDCVDAWTSRITPEEATRRAKLALIGQWPPVYRPWRQPLDWFLLITGLSLIGLGSSAYRHWSR